MAAVTGAIYWWYPIWETRQLRLKQLDPAEAPELFATLQELCNIASLRRRPEFLWNPVKSNHLALAFGRAGTYRVGFTGSLALQLRTDPGAFRAVMLHGLTLLTESNYDPQVITGRPR
jgi:hypothetical protein